MKLKTNEEGYVIMGKAFKIAAYSEEQKVNLAIDLVELRSRISYLRTVVDNSLDARDIHMFEVASRELELNLISERDLEEVVGSF